MRTVHNCSYATACIEYSGSVWCCRYEGSWSVSSVGSSQWYSEAEESFWKKWVDSDCCCLFVFPAVLAVNVRETFVYHSWCLTIKFWILSALMCAFSVFIVIQAEPSLLLAPVHVSVHWTHAGLKRKQCLKLRCWCESDCPHEPSNCWKLKISVVIHWNFVLS